MQKKVKNDGANVETIRRTFWNDISVLTLCLDYFHFYSARYFYFYFFFARLISLRRLFLLKVALRNTRARTALYQAHKARRELTRLAKPTLALNKKRAVVAIKHSTRPRLVS